MTIFIYLYDLILWIKMMEKIKIKKLNRKACLPEYTTDSDICFDIRAVDSVMIRSMETKEVKTGLAIEIPRGYVGLVRDRIGVVTKLGCHVVAGTFDSEYRSEVTIMMINFGVDEILIEEGMKIAQILILPVNKMEIVEARQLSKTKRTGKKYGISGLK